MAAAADLKIALLGFQRLSHPPYSPGLAPLDFAHFPMSKCSLGDHMFDDMVDILHSVQALTDSSVIIGSKMISNNGFKGLRSVWNNQAETLKGCDYMRLQVRADV